MSSAGTADGAAIVAPVSGPSAGDTAGDPADATRRKRVRGVRGVTGTRASTSGGGCGRGSACVWPITHQHSSCVAARKSRRLSWTGLSVCPLILQLTGLALRTNGTQISRQIGREPIFYAGWVDKEGGSVKSWKRRFLVLFRSHATSRIRSRSIRCHAPPHR